MGNALSLSPSYYVALKRLTLELAGITLGNDHRFLIETRLANLARKEGFPDLKHLVDELFSSGSTRLAVQAVSALMERDTHFFEDPSSFDSLTNTVLPTLYQSHKGGTVRILSFGCSSGQEPYGAAMRIDQSRQHFPDMKIDIIGVDYPSAALDRARAGQYTHFDVQRGLPIRDLITYFDRKGEDWVLKKTIRDAVTYRDFHLLSNLDDLGDFHVVMFRNTLGQYSSPAQIRVLRGLAGIVHPLGFLMLGTKESLKSMNYGFDAVKKTPGVFQRRARAPEAPEPEPKITPRKLVEFPMGR